MTNKHFSPRKWIFYSKKCNIDHLMYTDHCVTTSEQVTIDLLMRILNLFNYIVNIDDCINWLP